MLTNSRWGRYEVSRFTNERTRSNGEGLQPDDGKLACAPHFKKQNEKSSHSFLFRRTKSSHIVFFPVHAIAFKEQMSTDTEGRCFDGQKDRQEEELKERQILRFM